jgi:hypothetical protein
MNVMMCRFPIRKTLKNSELTRTSRLHHLRLHDGWSVQQRSSSLFHPVHHQRCHDRPCSLVRRPLGSSSHTLSRRFPDDDLAVYQRRSVRSLQCETKTKTVPLCSGINVHHWCACKGRHRMHLPIRRLICTDLGTSLLDLPSRTVPSPCPRKGSCSLDFR